MGASRTFDATNDTITMGDVLDFDRTEPFSIAMRHKATNTSPAAIHFPVSKQEEGGNFRGYNVIVRGDVAGDPWQVSLLSTGTNLISVEFPRSNDTVWRSIVATYSGSSAASGVLFYINGVAQTPTVTADSLTTTTVHAAPLRMGSRGVTPSQVGDCSLTCVSIYNVVLTAAEAQELARGIHVYRGLVGRWYLWDNGASPTYNDYAAGNDGTATNHPTESFDGPPIQFPGVM